MGEALSPADLSAIQAERGPVNMHVGGILILDGRVSREAVVGRLRDRIHLIPNYAKRLDEAPLGVANPVWVADPEFDPDRHVRRVGLPAPFGDAELSELIGHFLSDKLDRSRPLWQIMVVDGLAGGRSAVVAKMHHALVDGLAAVDVSTVILDPTEEGMDLPAPEEAPEPRRQRQIEQLTRLAAAQLVTPRRIATEQIRRRLTLDPREHARQVKSAAALVTELARVRPQAPMTRLNAEIGPDRVFAMARGRLEDVKTIKNATGSTVNDVLLAAVSLMLEDFLGPDHPDTAVALVPVSTRDESNEGELGNQISTVFVDLPLEGDPLDRVREISASMTAIKGSAQIRAGALLVGATGVAPPMVSALAVRAMGNTRMFNLVVSNVPGPQQTFYLAGVPVREVFPAVPLNPRNQAMSVGIMSYNGGINFGLLADKAAVPDVADAAAGLSAALDRLLAEVADRDTEQQDH